MPFADGSFDRVISAIALPYMNIQKALAEIHRILVPGGGVSLTLHLPSFTIAELLHKAIPKPVHFWWKQENPLCVPLGLFVAPKPRWARVPLKAE